MSSKSEILLFIILKLGGYKIQLERFKRPQYIRLEFDESAFETLQLYKLYIG